MGVPALYLPGMIPLLVLSTSLSAALSEARFFIPFLLFLWDTSFVLKIEIAEGFPSCGGGDNGGGRGETGQSDREETLSGAEDFIRRFRLYSGRGLPKSVLELVRSGVFNVIRN